MKQLLLLCAALLAGGTTLLAQTVVYVDADAGGTGDGTSWENAFTDLNAALMAADSNSQVWIAEGRYVTPAEGSFLITSDVDLYGGFAGDEDNLEDADADANETILSGDVNGNDTEGAFDSLSMADNNRVLTIVDTGGTAGYTVTLRGLTIRDGVIADEFPGGSLIPFSGGALYSDIRLDVSHVVFTANRAPFGSVVSMLFASSAGSVFDSIVSEGNYPGDSYEFYFRLTGNISLSNSEFTGTGDTVRSGMIYAQDVFGLNVENSSFADIVAPGIRGGAIQTAQTIGQRIVGCTFNSLHADLGGALYFRNGNDAFFTIDSVRPADATESIVDGCTFTGVTSRRWGGTIFYGNISHTISNSTFQNGFGAQSGSGVGSAIYAQIQDTFLYQFTIENTDFIGNRSGTNGGAVFYFSEGADVRIADSRFIGNQANFGGAMLIAGADTDTRTSTTIENCEFMDNICGATGGAIYIEDERFVISNSDFQRNSGVTGTVGIFGANDMYRIENCVFDSNGVANPYFRGAGVYAAVVGGNTPDSLMIDSCTFTNNVLTQQTDPQLIVSGGALFVSGEAGPRPYVGIHNTVFSNNATQTTADGAAIYVVDGAIIDITDSEISNNSAGGSGGAFFGLQFTTDTLDIDTVANDTVVVTFYPEDNKPEFRVRRSLILNNSAGNQGGVADLQVGEMTMVNNLVINNSVRIGEGSGGAIIINGTNNAPAQLENVFVNNTFYNNTDGGPATQDTLGVAGNAIALFQQGSTNPDSNSVTVTIQNNIFWQINAEDESIGIERTGDDGEIVVNSLGGNYFNSAMQPNFAFVNVDGSVDIMDTETEDVELFLDPTLEDLDTPFPNLDLIRGEDGENVLIDAGTTGPLVPEVDYFGEERDDMPDIGAIEYDGVRVDIPAEPIANSGLQLDFFPNPTPDVLHIVNKDASIQQFDVLISDGQGRLLAARRFAAANNRLDLSRLPAGVYNLTLLVNGKAYSQRVVRQ